jgi:hypothetical protein
VKEKTRSISTWHSYIQEQENRPGYARKNTPENYYKSYVSPKRWAFLSVSSLTFLLSKEKKEENTIEGKRVESKGEEKKWQIHQHQRHSIDPSAHGKARASTAAMKRESYTCKKVILPLLYV